MQPAERVPACPCWRCGTMLDGRTIIGELGEPVVEPVAGDVSICIRCAAPLVFTADLMTREPTADELVELALDPMFAKATEIVQRLVDERRAC